MGTRQTIMPKLGLSNVNPPLQTRRSLLGRLRNLDDTRSWSDFFDSYWKFIYSVAIRSGLTNAEAEEVVQETVIDVSRNMPGFCYDPAKGSFKGWLSQLTHWRIKDQLRQRLRDEGRRAAPPSDSSHPNSIENIPDPSVAAPSLWDEEWDRNLLELAVGRVKGRVKPKQYQMFDLYVMKEWPMKRVTEALGVNMGQVYLAKHRIALLIRREFKRVEAQCNASGNLPKRSAAVA